MHRGRVLTLVGLTLASVACGDEPRAPVRDAAYFLDRLHELDDLPRLESSTSELSATWDRAGGNALDGQTYPGVDGSTNVLLDVDGPGCIHRISTGLLEGDELGGVVLDATFELWLDGNRTLALPAVQLFDPELSPFAGPLVHDGAYPTVRMPIPFGDHARVVLVSPTQDWGLFWQIGYSRYPSDIEVETLQLPLDARTQRAFDAAGQAWLDSLSGPPVLGGDEPMIVASTLTPGDQLSWSDQGCGTIRMLELAVDPNWSATWRELGVRVTWDDAELPAVDMPAHRLLVGTDYGDDPLAEFDSLMLGAAEGRAYLQIPMPYRTGAHIELTNSGTFDFEAELSIWRERCSEQPDDFGYLHASVSAAPAATEDSPRAGPMQVPVHRVFEHEGRGKVVGTGLRIYWPYADQWWGEGDWQIWADLDFDTWPPSYHGTGTEEFYDGGWTKFDRRPLSGAVKQRPGLVTVYGFLLNDAFNYEREIRMQVETVGLLAGDTIIAQEHPEWVTTVYWYDEQPG